MALASFIAQGGQWMQVVVRAPTPGAAIAATQQYREWLQKQQAWDTQAKQLEVIDASTLAPGR